MTTVDVKVILYIRNEDGSTAGRVHGKSRSVRLNEDAVQVAAAGLAYGLVEDAWGLVDDE